MTKTDETQLDLDAMAKLIEAVKRDPGLLQDEQIRKGFDYACAAHKDLVKRLAKQLGMPEPSIIHPQASHYHSRHSEAIGSSIHSRADHPRHPETFRNTAGCHRGAPGQSDDFSHRQETSESLYHQVKRSSSHQRFSEYKEVSESTYQNLKPSGISRGNERTSEVSNYLLEQIKHLNSSQHQHRSSLSPIRPVRIAPPPPGPSTQLEAMDTPSRRSEHPQTRSLLMKRANSLHSRLSKSDVQDILKEAAERHLTPSGDHRKLQNSSTSPGVSRSLLRSAGPERGYLKPSGISSKTKSSHHIPTSSAMPSGLLMTSTMTKHVPRQHIRYVDHQPVHLNEHHNLATSSHVVEESFLEDGLSTTRDVPTIIDEVVEQNSNNLKNISTSKSPVKKTGKTVQLPTVSLPKRSKSMQNVSVPVPRSEYIPQTTIPKPFQLTLRKSIENTYAKKFVSDMMDEKKKQEEHDAKSLKNVKFRAKPVPKSTYQPTNTFATELKYVEAMRRKVERMAKKKFDEQNEMVRSKSEGNIAMLKPPGYVPPTTYISPIPVKPNARSRSATTRSAILIQEATTPKGIKSHRATSNLTYHLRHGRCKIDTSTAIQHRRMSPPDFQKIHAKVKDTYNNLSGKPSTVPQPFTFASRSHSASTRHTNCKEKEPEQFKKVQNGAKRVGSANPSRIPTTHAAQLREELNKAKIEKEKTENGGSSGDFWKEDNRKRIATFLGSRSKTEEDIAIRTRRKLQQQQETTQDYMRKLAEMKQRVLNGPLIMEKQTALAQEHRLKRKFEARMKTATEKVERSSRSEKSAQKSSGSSRRASEASAAGTFVVEKDYEEDFDEEEPSEKDSDEESESGSESESHSEQSGAGSGSGSKSQSKSRSGSQSSAGSSDEDSSEAS